MSKPISRYLRITALILFGLWGSLPANAQQQPAQAAEQLTERAAALYRQGRYQEAIPLAEQALALSETTFGPEAPQTMTALGNLALAYKDSAALAKAEQILQRLVTLTEKQLGPEHPETAFAVNLLAGVHADAGAYAKAEQLYQRALSINEKVLGSEHLRTALVLGNLAELYRVTGAYSNAEQLNLRALAIREKLLGPQDEATAISLNNLSLVYSAIGAFAKAEPLLQRNLAILERTRGPEHPDTANALSNLGELYRNTGAYAKAEPLLQRSLMIREKTLGTEHSMTLVSLNNLGLLYCDIGDYDRAEVLMRRVLEISEKVLGHDHPTTANSLNNLGMIYLDKKAYAQAEPLLQRAFEVRERALGPTHSETAASLNNLAVLYLSTGAYRKADALLQHSLAVTEAALGASHPNLAASLDNLAAVYAFRRAYTRAEALYERAEIIHEKNQLGFLLSAPESRQVQYVRRSVDRVTSLVILSLNHRSASSAALGLTSVLQYKGRVLDTMSGSIARLRGSTSAEDRRLFDQLAAVAGELSNLLYGGFENANAEDHRRRLDSLTRQQDLLQVQLSSRSVEFEQVLSPVNLDSMRHALPEDAVLVEWFRYYPPAGTSPAAGKLAPHYMAYVLTHTGDTVAIDVGEARPIEDLIVKFRSALTDPTSDSRGASRVQSGRVVLRKVAAELSKKLVRPLTRYIAKRRRLLISPDGALNLVPFAALLDGRGEYLAQSIEISYLTSGRDLLRIASDAPARSGAVVLAAPNYGNSRSIAAAAHSMRSADLDRSGLVFNPLPGTAEEADSLRSLLELDAQHVLTGDRVTEEQLRALHGPRILHLATHGFFLEDQDIPAALPGSLPFSTAADSLIGENPLLRSGLALAGANARSSGGTDDGILTAAEVAQLDLMGTQLVVLSACDTALGRVDAGEGVYGLRRALVLAGAQSQLVSLWKVDDGATRELMVDYYQRLLNGEGRAAALRATQRAMLSDPARRHPYYWAAFIPIGNWTPLKAQTSP